MIPKKVLPIDFGDLKNSVECYLIALSASGLRPFASAVIHVIPDECGDGGTAYELGVFLDQESAIEFCEMANEVNKKRGKK